MAHPYAVAATGQAILRLLSISCPQPEFADAQFELYQAKDFQSPMKQGVSLYLYRISPSGTIRNLPPRIAPNGRRYRPALPIDLHYILTAWATNAVSQQRLLGWSMRQLEDFSLLPASLLNQHGPETDLFHPGESVDLILEDVQIQDYSAIWEMGKPNIQPSALYGVRMLALDSSLEVLNNGLVQTREFDMGKVAV